MFSVLKKMAKRLDTEKPECIDKTGFFFLINPASLENTLGFLALWSLEPTSELAIEFKYRGLKLAKGINLYKMPENERSAYLDRVYHGVKIPNKNAM